MGTGPLLLHDNAPSHTSQLAIRAAARAGYEILQHPPYSPDLAPSDYFLFHQMKKPLRGRHFVDDIELTAEVDMWFETRPEGFFLEGIRALLHRWQKCIDFRGDYVEK